MQGNSKSRQSNCQIGVFLVATEVLAQYCDCKASVKLHESRVDRLRTSMMLTKQLSSDQKHPMRHEISCSA